MESSIKGGKNGLVADVEKFGIENRLLTESISLTTDFWETENGFGYNLNTGLINLTSANETAVLYIKNNEDQDLVIQNVIYILGNSTGGTGDIRATIKRNPTTGTIITPTPTAGSISSNRNFGSNQSLDIDFYKGAEADTITDGEDSVDTLLTSTGRYPLNIGDLILPKGSSIGICITPQASNTSMNIMVALPCYKVTVTI